MVFIVSKSSLVTRSPLRAILLQLVSALWLFSAFIQQASASPIVERSLEARAKKEEGASWSTPISGVPAWGWILIGVTIGALLGWGCSFAYWHKPSPKGGAASNRMSAAGYF